MERAPTAKACMGAASSAKGSEVGGFMLYGGMSSGSGSKVLTTTPADFITLLALLEPLAR